MNKLELMKARVADVKSLIEATEDEAKLKEFGKQLEELYIEIGKESAHLEADKAAKDAADKAAELERQEKANKSPCRGLEIVNNTPTNYKGVNIKRELDMAINGFSVGNKGLFDHAPQIRERMRANPEKAEKVLMVFADMWDKASKSPVRMKAEGDNALNEGTPADGGYLTPTEERNEILSYIRASSIALPNVTMVNMVSDSMTFPRELTKVSVAYTDEEGAVTESEGTFDQVTLTAKKISAYSIASNEVIEDAANNGGIAALLLDQFTEAIAQKIDSTVFIGTGSPVSGTFLYTGVSEVFSSGSTAFSELLESNIRNIVSKIPARYRGNAKWYTSTSVLWQYLRGLKDSNGGYMFSESRGGGAAPGNLWGYPVVEGDDDVMPSTSAAGTGLILFGNLRGFYIGQRLGNISLFIDPYSRSNYDQTKFFVRTRWAFAHGLPNNYGRIVTAGN